jgi:hypothetical protein
VRAAGPMRVGLFSALLAAVSMMGSPTLLSNILGIRNAFLNQPVEVARVRPAFAEWLGLRNQRPDLVVRFGRGPRLPVSLRRPVRAVLV